MQRKGEWLRSLLLLLQLLTVTEAAQVVVIELARRDREGRDRRSGWGGRMAGSTSISSLGWVGS